MKTPVVLATVLLGGTAASALAQETAAVNTRVVQSLPTKYTPPECNLKPGHYKVSSGATYLKTGIETEVESNKARALQSGHKVILEAIEKNGQEKNPAAWYFLGRISLQQGDIVGADSALTKAETLFPACKQDIAKVRLTAWVPLVNAGIEFSKSQKNDSALALYREANTIFRDKAVAFMNTGVIFANSGQSDSAAIYFQKASEIAERTNAVEERNAATRNWAASLQRAGKHQEAIPVFEKYVGWVPNDAEVKRALATSYRAAGQNEKAAVLEKEVGPAPGGAAASPAVAGASEMNAAIALYNEKKYQEAAQAFDKVVTSQPYNRDALYGLANSYVGLKNGPKLAETAEKLVAIEPMNEEIVRMLANGQRLAKQETKANKTAIRSLGMPVTISITQFAPTAAGASIAGTATGREAQTAQGKPVTAKPLTLVFEFLDAKGTVLGNQEVQVPALKPGQSQPIEAKVQAAGVAAWRYKSM